MMGILFMGRWPNGDPPAWAAGEARPWPTQAERRAEREAQAPGERSRTASRRSRPGPRSARPSSRRRGRLLAQAQAQAPLERLMPLGGR